MNKLLMCSGDYNIEAENACARLLTQFNTNFILDICDNTLSTKDSPSIISTPNIVTASEFSFKDLLEQFPGDEENIKMVRSETHIEIIQRLCSYYHAEFLDPGDEYHFMLARNYYYLLASGYSRCLIKFLSANIYKNRNELYDLLINDADIKKSKDITSGYYKRVCKNDPKLGLLIVYIQSVLDYILGLDISFHEILEYIFIKPEIIELMANSIKFEEPFYNYYKRTMDNTNYRPIIESNIILQLQSHYGNELDITA